MKKNLWFVTSAYLLLTYLLYFSFIRSFFLNRFAVKIEVDLYSLTIGLLLFAHLFILLFVHLSLNWYSSPLSSVLFRSRSCSNLLEQYFESVNCWSPRVSFLIFLTCFECLDSVIGWILETIKYLISPFLHWLSL